MYDLIIVGAGAAGSMAAILYAESKKNILLIDCNNLIGRKILSTGNGRCNFTNTNLNQSYFYSNNNALVNSIVSDFNATKIVDFFKELGIYSKEIDSYIYPITNSAATVQKVIADKINSYSNITFVTDNVVDIDKIDDSFIVTVKEQGQYKSKNVLISSGGLAKASLGNNKNGLKIAKKLGHKVIEPLPALVHLKSNSKYLNKLAKQRVYAKVILYIDGDRTEYIDIGEVQFNKDNISGIPVMNISSPAARYLNQSKAVSIFIDFVPYLSELELSNEISKRIDNNRGLEGLIPEKTIDALDLRILNGSKINHYVSKLKNLEFNIISTGNFEDAQVMTGGVSLSEVKDSLESKYINNLYFAGEILDVDAKCGGYNLTFAFASAKRVINSIKND